MSHSLALHSNLSCYLFLCSLASLIFAQNTHSSNRLYHIKVIHYRHSTKTAMKIIVNLKFIVVQENEKSNPMRKSKQREFF